MEEINGVTFNDYALASANAAAGMSKDEIAKVFGLELPVWEDAEQQWIAKMSELTPGGPEMQFFGEAFMKPKQGKFANVEGAADSTDKVLEKYPEWSAYVKMEKHFAVASEVGVNIDFQKEYGISMTEYSQLAMHWGGIYRDALFGNDEDKKQEISNEFTILTEKWEAHFKELYRDQNSGLSDDIDF